MCSRFPDRSALLLAIAIAATALVTGCEREERRFEPPAPGARVQMEQRASMIAAYERNAYAVSTGKRLWTWYNCIGCHSNGGGGMGAPLTDERWSYGSDPGNIFDTIVEGRPNGMPAFGRKVPRQQIWQLVAYVRSMSGQVPSDAAPARNDEKINLL